LTVKESPRENCVGGGKLGGKKNTQGAELASKRADTLGFMDWESVLGRKSGNITVEC